MNEDFPQTTRNYFSDMRDLTSKSFNNMLISFGKMQNNDVYMSPKAGFDPSYRVASKALKIADYRETKRSINMLGPLENCNGYDNDDAFHTTNLT